MFVIGLYLGFGVAFMASSVSIFSTDISLNDMYQSYIFKVQLYTRTLTQLFRSERLFWAEYFICNSSMFSS